MFFNNIGKLLDVITTLNRAQFLGQENYALVL